MTRKESMIKVLRYKAEHIKTKIKPEFFNEVADVLESIERGKDNETFPNSLGRNSEGRRPNRRYS